MRRVIHTRGGPVSVERTAQTTTARLSFKGQTFQLSQSGPRWRVWRTNRSGFRRPPALHEFRLFGNRAEAERTAADWIIDHVGYDHGEGERALHERLGARYRRVST